MSTSPGACVRGWDLAVVALGGSALVTAGVSAVRVPGAAAVVIGVVAGVLTGVATVLGPRGLLARAARARSVLVPAGLARRAGDDPRFLPVPVAAAGRATRALPWVLSVTSLLLVGAFLAGVPVTRPAVVLAWAGLAVLLAHGMLTFVRGGHALGDDLTDPLTGLASREALSEALASEGTGDFAGGRRRGLSGWTDRVALLLADIDGFDGINATLGREAGDAVLTEVGARLRAVLRPPQLLARLGGDEFALLLPGAGLEASTRVAATLREALRTPLDVGGGPACPSRPRWAGLVPAPRGRPEDLLRQADAAVPRAKATSSGIAVYDADKDGSGPVRLRRVDELRSALEQGDVVVHLQPQVELATGAVVGCEALARWRHPHDGVLLPDAFLPLAATTGLMRPVTDVVLDRALEACASWWPAHPVAVGVNVTAVDLLDPGLTDRITRRLARHALPGAALRGGDHGGGAGRRAGGGRAAAAGLAAARHHDRAGRLRHRVLLARLPARAALRRAEARPGVRLRPRPAGDGDDRAALRGDGARARTARRGRGRRGRDRSAPAGGPRLRRRPGPRLRCGRPAGDVRGPPHPAS